MGNQHSVNAYDAPRLIVGTGIDDRASNGEPGAASLGYAQKGPPGCLEGEAAANAKTLKSKL